MATSKDLQFCKRQASEMLGFPVPTALLASFLGGSCRGDTRHWPGVGSTLLPGTAVLVLGNILLCPPPAPTATKESLLLPGVKHRAVRHGLE